MLRSKKILVSFLFIFFLAFGLKANEPKGDPIQKEQKMEAKKENVKIKKAPVVPNLDNDQWQKLKKRIRIPRQFEGTLPLLTYKEQQVA